MSKSDSKDCVEIVSKTLTNEKEEESFYSKDDRVVRKRFQIFCALGANLMLFCFGLIFPQSGFILPQLEDPDTGFGIDKEQGSWFGKSF